MSFFGTVLTTLVTILTLYVLWRLYPIFKSRQGRSIFLGLGISFWIIFFLSRIFRSVGFFEVIGMHWMGSCFLLAISIFAIDIISGFGFWFRPIKAQLRLIGLAVGIILIFVAHLQGLRSPRVIDYQVSIKNLPADLEGTKIVMLADLHIGEMMIDENWLNDRVKEVQALDPDIIVLVGDLFEHESKPSSFIPVLRALKAPLGVFAVRGNHDRIRSNREDVMGQILTGAGIKILSNEWEKIQEGFIVAGIDDLTSSRRELGLSEKNMKKALSDRAEGVTIFLSHSPWQVENAASMGIDLMLSGHTHNGQIWPFNFLVATRYPFINGHYTVDEMSLIVSSGTGTWGPRMRLWQRGEISLITLRAKTNI